MNVQIPAEVKQALTRVVPAGGRVYLAGGAVLDAVAGREPKDLDFEVYHLSYEQVVSLFAEFSPNTVGRSFGVVKMKVGDYDLDINLPRRDNKNGVGHQGFSVEVDHTMTIEEAARRRDFTINAMSVDVFSGEFVDPYGGMADLAEGRLRAVDPSAFAEDPLRVFRAMQLLARKAKFVDPRTLLLAKAALPELGSLPKERIYAEFEKLFLKAPKPSVGIQLLDELGVLDLMFPEVAALKGCEQNAQWHPEGDVYVHSLLALDNAALVRHHVAEDQRFAFVAAAFLHDLGKPAETVTQAMIDRRDPRVAEKAAACGRTPQEMLLTAHGHDVAGMDPAESFLRRMMDATKPIGLVKALVGAHMRPFSLVSGGAGKGRYARLHRDLAQFGGDLFLLGRVCQCDSCATGFGKSLASGEPDWEHATSQRLFEYADEFANSPKATEPLLKGRDLLAAGVAPGQEMGRLLKRALELQEADDSLTAQELLAAVLPQ